jgi:hypothetical protein
LRSPALLCLDNLLRQTIEGAFLERSEIPLLVPSRLEEFTTSGDDFRPARDLLLLYSSLHGETPELFVETRPTDPDELLQTFVGEFEDRLHALSAAQLGRSLDELRPRRKSLTPFHAWRFIALEIAAFIPLRTLERIALSCVFEIPPLRVFFRRLMVVLLSWKLQSYWTS